MKQVELKDYKQCVSCVMDTTDPEITFDDQGVCDFCHSFQESIIPNWNHDEQGYKKLLQIAEQIKREGKRKEYDCIIGMSGGVDSSYLVYIAKVKLGLRPLVLTVDTGWNLNVANENVFKIIKALNLDLETIVVNWEEMKDLQVAFLKSQVPYQDLPQDHVIFAGLYNYANKYKIKYILTGGNYSTEGIKPPQEWTYLNDIRFIKAVHKKYGRIPLKTFPLCGMFKYKLYYGFLKGMKVIHPLNLIPYEKELAVKELKEKFGWEQYANKHYENIFTRFYEGYYLPKKFGYDKRKCYFSNLILTGQMSRTEALTALEQNPYDNKIAKEDMEYICQKLDITMKDLTHFLEGNNKTFRDYKNNEKVIKFAIRMAIKLGLEKRNFRV